MNVFEAFLPENLKEVDGVFSFHEKLLRLESTFCNSNDRFRTE